MYQRKYRKVSKKWDVTPVKEKKEYSYVPDIMQRILDFREDSTIVMRKKVVMPAEHPSQVQATIGHIPPAATNDIVQKNHQDSSCMSLYIVQHI